jgi:hypothetical protein
MVLSDAFIGFYSYVYWVYGTIIILALVGLWLRERVKSGSTGKKIGYIFGTTLASSVIFFIITNFGVWTSGMFYEMTLSGLMQSYTAAIPFFRNSLMGDLVYVTAMFGIYELVKRFAGESSLQESKIRK